jgi:hypothetical protein
MTASDETVAIPKALARRVAAFIEKHDLPWDGEFCEHDLDLISGNLDAKRRVLQEMASDEDEKGDAECD